MVKTTKVISVEQLIKQDLAQLAPISVVLGQEQVLLAQTQQYFDQLLSPDERQLNYSKYDLSETNLSTVLDDAMSMPFFGDYRLIILTNPTFLTGETTHDKLDQPIELLLDYLKQPQPSTKLVFWADYGKLDSRKKITKQLQKVATTVNVEKITGNQLDRYLVRDCSLLRVNMSKSARILLGHRVQEDYSAANAQLKLLALYAGVGQEITEDMVATNVDQVIDDNVFELVTATLNHHLGDALLLYRQLLLNGSEPIALLALILGQVRLLLQVKILQNDAIPQGEIAQKLKVHPYRVQLALKQSRVFHTDQLKQMFLELVELDFKIKTGQADKQTDLELLITKFAS